MSSGGAGVALTRLNDSILSGSALTPPEEIFVREHDKTRVYACSSSSRRIFRRRKKYPVLLLIHAGRRARGARLELSLERADIRVGQATWS